ncbi:MAG: hypothetical protein M1832_000209 [Thelocarpon impressellum]|nr:MAG: hypothetical protein M1832_000209 [Thelocarpon impressellum]
MATPTLDPRVSHQTAELNGRNYHYLLGLPTDKDFRATAVLVHGWPDISFGWRHQIPILLDLGLRVVVPDMMGYGGTDGPKVPPEPIELYGHKRAADDIKELARQLGAPQIILGGHDWGGSIVFRVALWHPELVTHIFSVCTPYLPPSKTFTPLEDVVRTVLPNFAYQLQLAGPEVEARIQTKPQIRQFLNAMYGGRGPNGEVGFDVRKGVLLDNLGLLGKTPLLTEGELDYYAEQYVRTGLHGPLNWYRTRKTNYDDEQSLGAPTIGVPTLLITASKDAALSPALAQGMQTLVPRLTRAEVEAGHWALVQAAPRVNEIVSGWFEGVVFGEKSVL